MLRFLSDEEALNMQATNRFHYEIAVSRVCTTFTLTQDLLPYFDVDPIDKWRNSTSLVFHDLERSRRYVAMNTLRDALGVVQAG